MFSFSGHPPPQVLWFQEGEVVDATFNVSNSEVFNVLDVPATRSDLESSFVCQAINNDLKRPQDVTYRRNVTCKFYTNFILVLFLYRVSFTQIVLFFFLLYIFFLFVFKFYFLDFFLEV